MTGIELHADEEITVIGYALLLVTGKRRHRRPQFIGRIYELHRASWSDNGSNYRQAPCPD